MERVPFANLELLVPRKPHGGKAHSGFCFQSNSVLNDFLIPKMVMFIIFKCRAILQKETA